MIVGHEKPLLDEALLVHFGIKGMKWGVRRKLTKEGNLRTNQYMANVEKRQQHAFKEITQKEYNSLSSAPIKLGVAGSTFHRVAGAGDNTLRDFAYVTKSEKDHTRYKVALGSAGNRKMDMTVKVNAYIISPSKKERIDTFIKTLDTDIKVTDLNGKVETMKGRKYLESVGVGSAFPKALNNREFGLKTYGEFAQGQVMRTPIHEVYASSLKKKGYNALVDDADAGMMSDLPIILFPKESSASVVSIKPISRDEMIVARSEIEVLDRS